MNLGQIIKAPCINLGEIPNPNCNDPAFALLNPGVCGSSPQLVIKPETALCCLLGGMSYQVVQVQDGQETDVTAQCTFQTSNPDIVVIGASSGRATGVGDGEAVITAIHNGLSAQASLTIIGAVGDCCKGLGVALMVLVDDSLSMSQSFNAGYQTKLAYAKVAAKQFTNEVNGTKDMVGLISFDDNNALILSDLTHDNKSVAALVDSIGQTQQLTGFSAALKSAISALNASGAEQLVLVIISDGVDTSKSDSTDTADAIIAAEQFKLGGGVVMCLGARASNTGFNLLEAMSSGGFFVNGYGTTAADALANLCAMKGYVCAGNCVPAGDEYVNKGQFDYCGFANWNVIGGHVDLLGNGFLDYIPGNGLYVELAGSSAPHDGQMVSKNSFSLKKGDVYRLSMNLAGNQRVAGSPNTVQARIFGRNSDGLSNPASAPVLTVNDTGNPLSSTPTYKYVYTYTNANGETAPSPMASATPTKDGASIVVQAASNSSASKIRIYRTTGAAPDSPYYLIAEIANTAPAYTDYMNEADMIAAMVAGTVDVCSVAPTSNTTGSTVNYLNQSVSINDYQQGFTPQSFTFTAPDNLTVWISIQQTASPKGANSTGLLLDSISLDDTTTLVNILSDDFSTENPVYIPPACGTGKTFVPGYGYETGYSCYGAGCLSTPPPPQLPDPNPLPDIESGYTPPVVYKSTKQVCVGCPDGYVNLPTTGLIPTMTSNTEPSGVASASSVIQPGFEYTFFSPPASGKLGPYTTGSLPQWCQYKFDTPQTPTSYEVSGIYDVNGDNGQPLPYPKTFSLQASNDGATWTTLDTQTVTGWVQYQINRYAIKNPSAYLYFRMVVTDTLYPPNVSGGNLITTEISNFNIFLDAPQTECASASATSSLSQADADAQATAAATAAAQAKLNCVQVYTATESYTATCPLGKTGSITKSATAISYNSLQVAQANALQAAIDAANAALVCACNDTSASAVAINANSAATPYPSVKCVSGKTGNITKVTATISGLSHTLIGDVAILLMSPSGTLVDLMSGCGSTCPVSGLNLIFDDSAASNLPATNPNCSNPLVSGTFKPTKVGVTPSMPLPCPSSTINNTLAAFIGEDPNGSWCLFVASFGVFDTGSIASFTLNITSA